MVDHIPKPLPNQFPSSCPSVQTPHASPLLNIKKKPTSVFGFFGRNFQLSEKNQNSTRFSRAWVLEKRVKLYENGAHISQKTPARQ